MENKQFFLLPVEILDFNINLCDGMFGDDTPMLKNRDGETYTLMPKNDRDNIKIMRFKDGFKQFMHQSAIYAVGVQVQPNEQGLIHFNM